MYLLITVIEMEILTEEFPTYENAYAAMKKEFDNYGGDQEKIEDGEANIHEFDAWIEDGNNHDNYSWRIVELD